MKPITFQLELITPCFCGGAEPDQRAEIRAPSIRGQLRWWFRTLGGFKSLPEHSVPEQEQMIFGSTAGDAGRAGRLIVRVSQGSLHSTRKDADQMKSPMLSERGYLLFPLRSKRDQQTKEITEYKGRGVFDTTGLSPASLPSFQLSLLWRGEAGPAKDLHALAVVFGHLGAVGFRSRRAMGALAFKAPVPDLQTALACFRQPDLVKIRELVSLKEPAKKHIRDADDAIMELGFWLKDWRSHGRTSDHASAKPPNPPHNTGFEPFAQNDHDRGADWLADKGHASDPTYRPAIGLPIIQRFKNGTVNWDQSWNPQRNKGEGRFASPVILRPYRVTPTRWRALVIFVDAHQWPAGKPVYLTGTPRAVSLDLYEAMKNDPRLAPFLGSTPAQT